MICYTGAAVRMGRTLLALRNFCQTCRWATGRLADTQFRIYPRVLAFIVFKRENQQVFHLHIVVESKLPHPAFEFVRHFEIQVNEFCRSGCFRLR